MKDSTKYTVFLNFVISRQIINFICVKTYGVPLYMIMKELGL